MHDYGITMQDKIEGTQGWQKHAFKKVVLTNAGLAKNRITVDQIEKHLEGALLRPEWERKQAYWLVKAVADAAKKGEKTADITQMFSCDLISHDDSGRLVLHRDHIQNELMYKLFSRVYETEEELGVKLDWKVIFL